MKLNIAERIRTSLDKLTKAQQRLFGLRTMVIPDLFH